ncbi:WbqC family protein [Thalassospira sp.]|uniref:WbqC family protein n=1 Tax=Thalassospira sp. TaxID=1912094 RepID=UPI000C647DD4|nr:WbqC family protein [Thalassospira sp.]MBC08119.1 hypothetical protein [Thalassospira sp.]|tara:strand:- start:13609 stop:14340 length:732 start_codon:yes stop_codon:yes gene_type:complete
MKLGIMQPYFFPYMGYFDLIVKTDHWVVFDVVKYQSKSWMNRNRIQEPNKGEQFISAPIIKKSGHTISEMQVLDFNRTAEKLLRQLNVYCNKAPYFDAVREMVANVFSECADDKLCSLNISGLRNVCRFLDIPFSYDVCSELDLDFSAVTHAGQWALEISKQLGASTYINPSGGVDLFDYQEWQSANIGIEFTRLPSLTFDVPHPFKFKPNLSIIDTLMWNKPETVVEYLQNLPTFRHPDALQ